MPDALAHGLDLRSPDARLTFRNRVAKELRHASADALREQAAKISGDTKHLKRLEAIRIIADERIRQLLERDAA